MTTDERTRSIIEALGSGVVPATGCTEPISLAYAAARAAEVLGEEVEAIEASVSPNVMKNGMAVMIPGTGLPGLQIAAAVGALDGDPSSGLRVLAHVSDEALARARELVDAQKVTLTVVAAPEALFAEAVVHGAGHSARVAVAGGHTTVVLVERDGEVLESAPRPDVAQASPTVEFLRTLTLREIYDFATTVELSRIAFLLDAEKLNEQLVAAGLGGQYGLAVGATMMRGVESGLTSNDLSTRMIAHTAAASDARMGGAPLPAMTNAGSGNQGITATIPVSLAADHVHASEEQRIRALALSHLTALYVHANLPVLSAFCAAVTAGMGSAAGMAYLLDGRYETVERAVVTMAGDSIGMVCDGAGASCTMKVATSVGSASRAVMLALGEQRVPGTNGMVHDDVDETIRGIGRLVSEGMARTDPEILQIMMSKPQNAR